MSKEQSIRYLVSLRNNNTVLVCESETKFKAGEKVVVETEFGLEVGTILNLTAKENVEGNINRKATERDVLVFKENIQKSLEIKKAARQEVKKLKLEMKIVDVTIPLGRSQAIVTFTADGRVDFRMLVKNLSGKIHRSVRMQQIGSRDEARRLGGCGVCGRELCCLRLKGELPSITTEMARQQQINHRGSERISGVCGRLMCCLSYEAKQYEKALQSLPQKYSRIKIEGQEGEVVEINVLKEEIKVRLDDGQIIRVNEKDLK